MRSAALIFAALCSAGDLVAAVANLPKGELIRLANWLREQEPSSIGGLVLGLAELECCERFLKQG